MFSPLRHVVSHRLPNGLRVLLKEDHSWPLVSVQSWVNVGSVDESESEAGLAHVLEHMVFKGTAGHDAAEISRWIEAQGGALNAETSKEYTHYYIDIPTDGRLPAGRQAGRAVHLMAELLVRARLDPEEWRRECPVILEEIKRRNDDAETVVWELLQQAIYRNLSHSRAVIGTPTSVSALSAGDVQRFYRAHYTTENSLIVITGDFRSRDMMDLLKREFRSMPKGGPPRNRPPGLLQTKALSLDAKKPVQQAYAVYAFPTPPAEHRDQEALDLMAVLLGDGRNARLVERLREDQKLVWSIGASNITHEGPGIFAIFAEFDVKNRDKVARAVRALLRDLRAHPPTTEELHRAKNMMQTSWLQGYETFHSQAATLGAYALENHLPRLKGYLPKILSLQKRDLRRIVDDYFSADLASAVIAP